MERIFVVVTPVCPHHPWRKVLSMDCRRCDDFRGGIIESFVDCAHNRPEIARKPEKIEQKRAKKERTPKKAIPKPVKTRKKKNG